MQKLWTAGTMLLLSGMAYLMVNMGLTEIDRYVCRNVSIDEYAELGCTEVLGVRK